MNPNLKNRPSVHILGFNDSLSAEFYSEVCIEWEKWFEGFEAKLRESYKFFEKQWHPRSEANKLQRSTILYHISQILGEEPKE